MHAWQEFRRWSAGIALAVMASTATTPVLAESAEWMRVLGPGYGNFTGPAPSDREFIREWEKSPEKGLPTLSKGNIVAMKAAIARYTAIAAKGGWRRLPANAKLEQGTTDAAVAILRERLVMSGEMKDSDGSDYFGYELAQAVRRYQEANGLPPTGVVDKATVAALNVTAAGRLKQLRINLNRLRALGEAPRKFIFVNIPATQIEAIANDKVASRHAGVVGKIDRQTPLLRSSIQQLNFNAVWHLPPTVINEDLIPTGRKMARRGQSALVKFKIDAYSGGRKLDPTKVNWNAAQALTFRQQPGPENPLGFVKLNFPNAHSVYMHDTPGQSVFGRTFRAASSGCVRVSGIEKLAAWIAADEGWKPEQVHRMKETGERYDLRLKHPIPLYFAYITAWATRDGAVHFRRDIYNKDGLGKQAGKY
ncbi:MAG TPA: L,D-transpeptidase family protein [Hyphomicrobiaceae bacterium]|nr:L,D-transpeptidase family protein [Hyphomicrobiaceae bacterium]